MYTKRPVWWDIFFADQNVLRKQKNSDMYIFNIDKAFVLNITLSCWFASFRWQIEFQKSREFFINHLARVSRSMIYVEYFSPYMTTQRVPFKFFCFFHVKIVKSTKKNDKFSFLLAFQGFTSQFSITVWPQMIKALFSLVSCQA